MRNVSGATARKTTQATALLLPVSRRLRSVPDDEDTAANGAVTVVTASPHMEMELEEDDFLDIEGTVDALVEETERGRRQLRAQLDSAMGRIGSAEEDLVRLRKSNVARRNEIIALQSRSKRIERHVSVHDLALAELHRVILPAMNDSLSAAHQENLRLHYRVASLEAANHLGQARLTVAQLAHPTPLPPPLPAAPPAPAKGWPAWIHYANALVLSALGFGLALSLLL